MAGASGRSRDLDALGRNDAYQRIVDRLAVDNQFGSEAQDVWGGLSDMLPVLVTPLPHDVQEQDAALAGSVMYSTAEATSPDIGPPGSIALSIGMFRPHLSGSSVKELREIER